MMNFLRSAASYFNGFVLFLLRFVLTMFVGIIKGFTYLWIGIFTTIFIIVFSVGSISISYEGSVSMEQRYNLFKNISLCKHDLVQEYANSGNDVDVTMPINGTKATALMYAVINGCDTVVKVLLDAGADPDTKVGLSRTNALNWAVIARNSLGSDDVDNIAKYDSIIAMLGESYQATDKLKAI